MAGSAPVSVPKWLKPLGLREVDSFEVRIDPALRVDEETAYLLEQDAGTLFTEVTAFMTSNYDAPLAAEVIQRDGANPYVLIRAATGDETLDLLSTADDTNPDSARQTITWQEGQDGAPVTEPAVLLWSGEVLLNSGQGEAGPFYTFRIAACAWAFSTALKKPAGHVCSAQVVTYLCARSVAGQLMEGGEAEFRRLNRFWVAPARSAGVDTVRLPHED